MSKKKNLPTKSQLAYIKAWKSELPTIETVSIQSLQNMPANDFIAIANKIIAEVKVNPKFRKPKSKPKKRTKTTA